MELLSIDIAGPTITLERLVGEFECSLNGASKISEFIAGHSLEYFPEISKVRESLWDRARSDIRKLARQRGVSPVSTDIQCFVRGRAGEKTIFSFSQACR